MVPGQYTRSQHQGKGLSSITFTDFFLNRQLKSQSQVRMPTIHGPCSSNDDRAPHDEAYLQVLATSYNKVTKPTPTLYLTTQPRMPERQKEMDRMRTSKERPTRAVTLILCLDRVNIAIVCGALRCPPTKSITMESGVRRGNNVAVARPRRPKEILKKV